MNHAILVLRTERAILRDNHRHLRAGGEPSLSDAERADLLAEILRELRDLDRALLALAATPWISVSRSELSHPPTDHVKLPLHV